jgi:predicted membrane channel-forming protein YqfA (hemolysin III family)
MKDSLSDSQKGLFKSLLAFVWALGVITLIFEYTAGDPNQELSVLGYIAWAAVLIPIGIFFTRLTVFF